MLAFQANNALRLKQLNPPRLGRALRLQRGVYEGFLKLYGQEHPETLRAANDLAVTLSELQPPSYKEVKALLRRTLPVAGCVLGKDVYNGESESTYNGRFGIVLKMRWVYAEALYKDAGATLAELREAVATLEETTRTTRRVLGGAHRLTSAIEDELRKARAALRRSGRSSEPTPDDETTSRCVICMASQSDHFCIPCGHVVFCGSCARDPRLERKCPVCREHVEGVRRVEARPRAAAAPDARRAQTEARSYLPTPWSVEGQAAAERRFLERCLAAERQAAERQRQAEAWTPADEEELAALRLEAARRQREEAAERRRQEAAERRRQEAAAERQRQEAAAARRRRQEAAANKAQEAAKRRAEARPPAGMTGLEMQSWQRRAIDRIRDIDAEKEPDMILGVQRGAPKHEVKEAYQALAILFHPDKCGAPDASDAMQKINTARQKLFLAATSERECAPPPPPPRTPSTSSTPPPRSPPPRPTERCIIQ
ncbi:unnamed protein product [Pelagomonas calceolata]|uniref:RING-type E3 ubiquitin transferase n=3 Tax=Pelagomonas calceolata TaxID=35677 RepID=A0A8J2SRC2_9STRA|nr:unnamed protein product [Pelagomonas calceolata]